MKEPISLQEQRLLAAIIFSGFCANSSYSYVPDYHIQDTVKLLNKLLSAIDESREVKWIKERKHLENGRGENALQT